MFILKYVVVRLMDRDFGVVLYVSEELKGVPFVS